MIVIAAIGGYLIGSMPTAVWLGYLWGVDLRTEGSGNPGANNARRLGGIGLAGLVLTVEIAKGAGAVVLGGLAAGEWGAAVGGVSAAAGNVYNVWYRFAGGKGLGISAGVLLAAWPNIFLPIIGVIALAAILTRSSGMAALAAIGAINLFALVWTANDLPAGPWGLDPGGPYILISLGLSLVIVQKHLRDAIRPRALREPRVSESPDRH